MTIHEVFPYLIVRDAPAAIRFYQRAFGATEKFRLTEPSGRVGHAELDFGGTVLMFADEFPEFGVVGPQSLGGTTFAIHLHVDDADEALRVAVEAGATLVRAAEGRVLRRALRTHPRSLRARVAARAQPRGRHARGDAAALHRAVPGFVSRAAFLFLGLASLLVQDWRRVEPGFALEFRDHASHPEYRTEWWYSTGHLEDKYGAAYGFQFTIFRRGLDPRPLNGDSSACAKCSRVTWPWPTSLHGSSHAERLRRAGPLARSSEERLELTLEDWSLTLDEGGALQIAAGDPANGIGLELELSACKPLVLHRGSRLLAQGPGGRQRLGLRELDAARRWREWSGSTACCAACAARPGSITNGARVSSVRA